MSSAHPSRSTQSVIVLAGPTASGKTGWAIELAKQIGGVVIAADSRTVYRGLDIGTGKVTYELPTTWKESSLGRAAVVSGVEHYGLDLVDPTDRFTAADFQRYVERLLPQIWRRGDVPLLVGGSTLYIEAVIDGFQFPEVASLSPDWRDRPLEALYQELVLWDPELARQIDPSNRVRIERALGYVFRTGQSIAKARQRKAPDFRHALFVIDRPRDELYARIDSRLDTWIRDGLFDEVAALRHGGVPDERIRAFGLVYKRALEVVDGALDEPTFRRVLQGELHAYARRQLTWWRRRTDVQWVSRYTEVAKETENFLRG